MPTQLLTAKDIARLMPCCVETARSFMRASGIKTVKVGRRLRVPVWAWEEYLAKGVKRS